jgi:hypothetical protein
MFVGTEGFSAIFTYFCPHDGNNKLLRSFGRTYQTTHRYNTKPSKRSDLESCYYRPCA